MLLPHKRARSWTVRPPAGHVHPKSAVLRLSRSGFPLVASIITKTASEGSFRLLAYGTEGNLSGLAESISASPGWLLNEEVVAAGDADLEVFTGRAAFQAIQTSSSDVAGAPHSSGASSLHEAYAESASMVSVSSAAGAINKKSGTASDASGPTRTTSTSASMVRAHTSRLR